MSKSGYGKKRYLKIVEENALRLMEENHCAVVIWPTEANARASRQRLLSVFKDSHYSGIKTAVRGNRLYMWYENTFHTSVLTGQIVSLAEPDRIDLEVISGKEYNKPESIQSILQTGKKIEKEVPFKTWSQQMKESAKKPTSAPHTPKHRPMTFVEDLAKRTRDLEDTIAAFKEITPTPEQKELYDKRMAQLVKSLDDCITTAHEMNNSPKQYSPPTPIE